MFAGLRKISTFASAIAEIAQLVEHNLAKVRVASSSLVFRSFGCIEDGLCPGGGIGRRARFRCVCREACRFESCSGHFTPLQKGESSNAEIAQLVEHNLAKVRVASSSLVFRSFLRLKNPASIMLTGFFCCVCIIASAMRIRASSRHSCRPANRWFSK